MSRRSPLKDTVRSPVRLPMGRDTPASIASRAPAALPVSWTPSRSGGTANATSGSARTSMSTGTSFRRPARVRVKGCSGVAPRRPSMMWIWALA